MRQDPSNLGGGGYLIRGAGYVGDADSVDAIALRIAQRLAGELQEDAAIFGFLGFHGCAWLNMRRGCNSRPGARQRTGGESGFTMT